MGYHRYNFSSHPQLWFANVVNTSWRWLQRHPPNRFLVIMSSSKKLGACYIIIISICHQRCHFWFTLSSHPQLWFANVVNTSWLDKLACLTIIWIGGRQCYLLTLPSHPQLWFANVVNTSWRICLFLWQMPPCCLTSWLSVALWDSLGLSLDLWDSEGLSVSL